MKNPFFTYNTGAGLDAYKALEKMLKDTETEGSSLSKQEFLNAIKRLNPTDYKYDSLMIGVAAPKIGTAISLSDVLNVEGKTPVQAARDHVESYGIEFAPQNQTINSVVGRTSTPPIFESIKIPFSEIKIENLRSVFFAIKPLDDFFGQNKIDEKYIKNTKLSFATTPEEFAKKFYQLHPDQVGQITPEKIKNNTVGFNVSSGADGKREIVINLQLSKERAETSAFGESLLSETIAHEYAHSIQQTMSPTWGQDGDQATEEYRSIFESDPNISKYSDKNISEHFAENFARYVISGKASPEFVEYLKSKQIEKIDTSSLMHPLMKADIKADLENLLNTEDSPVTFKFLVSAPAVSESEVTLRFRQTNKVNLRNRRAASLEILAKDPAQFGGRTTLDGGNGVFIVNEDGKLEISGDLLRIADSAQGQGIGSAFLQKMSQFISLNGGGKINITAALQNGPYMWAISGFEFADRWESNKYIEIAQDMIPLVELWKQNQDKLSNYDLESKRSMTKIMSAPARAAEQYLSALSPEQAELARAFRSISPKFGHSNDIRLGFLTFALENNFNITDEDIEQLRKLGVASPGTVLPAHFANIGRKTKPESSIDLKTGRTKKGSSLGRAIMMVGGAWRGFLNIPAAGGN